MGLFSNGTEGLDWRSENCDKCLHDLPDEYCPIWAVHQSFNYDQTKRSARGRAIKEILSTLIPTDGIYNQPCSMLMPRELSEEVRHEEYLKELQEGKSPVYGVPV